MVRTALETSTPAGQAPGWRRRLAAAAALICLAVAVGLLGYLLISRIVVLPLTLAAMVVAALAGWTGLVSRGLRRWLSLAAAVVALVAGVLIMGLATLVGAIVVAVLVVASAASARAAIGRHRPVVAVPAVSPPESTPVQRATRAVLLVNPRSGDGSVSKSGLIAKAGRRGIACVMLREGDNLRAVAEREVAAGAAALGIAGGDGSQAIVADVARRHDIAFVCVPAGTRNHFAQDLGLDRRDPVRALDAFGPAVERRVDLATVNGRVFVNNASMGVYGAIVAQEGYREAKFLTAAGQLPDLVGPDAERFDLRFTGPDGVNHETTDLLLVSNNAYAVATPAGLASRPRLDAGELGVVSLRTRRWPAANRSTGEATDERATDDRATDDRAAPPASDEAVPDSVAEVSDVDNRSTLVWTAATFRVDSAQPVPIGIDGEAFELDPPLEFVALPGALRVRLAPDVTSPAAAGPLFGVPATVRALLRVLANRPDPDSGAASPR